MAWFFVVWILVLVFGVVVFRGAPYVPSKRRDIEKALTELYSLSAKDVLVDAGSGDGVVLRTASRLAARAVGFELNPILVIVSRLLSLRDSRVVVKLADFWLTPLPDDTTVVYGFLVTRDVKKMVRKMKKEAARLNRPLRYISYGSSLTGMTPDRSLNASRLYTFLPLQTDEA
jgi:hypothetical protein